MDVKLLEYIYVVEGDYLHRNYSEKDVTSPGGIYKHVHPDASIWSYIESVASAMDIHANTNTWSKQDIDRVNAKLDKTLIDLYVKEFYDSYLSGAHLELFPEVLKIVMFNIYTNTTSGAWKAIQSSLIDLAENDLIPLEVNELSTVDGKYGKKTKNGLLALVTVPVDVQVTFKFCIYNNMKTHYVKLATKHPEKYGKYLNGWINRIDNLKKVK